MAGTTPLARFWAGRHPLFLYAHCCLAFLCTRDIYSLGALPFIDSSRHLPVCKNKLLMMMRLPRPLAMPPLVTELMWVPWPAGWLADGGRKEEVTPSAGDRWLHGGLFLVETVDLAGLRCNCSV